jgi:hypothetical protein
LAEHGQASPEGSHGFPDGLTVVSRDNLQDQFYSDAKAKEADIPDDTLSKRFRRAIGELVKSQQIGTLGQWFWLDSRTKLWTCPDIEFFVRTILPGRTGQV